MPRLSHKISILISLILTFLLLIALGFAAYWVPELVESALNVNDNLGNRTEVSENGRFLVLLDAYAMLTVAAVAVILLFFLLRTVQREEVFTPLTTRLLSAVSLCCFAEGVLFALLVPLFQLAVGIALAACFLGLCLRVVGNVIDEASRIKSENDFTI